MKKQKTSILKQARQKGATLMRFNNLPKHFNSQAVRIKAANKSKYLNTKAVCNGITFDSKKEMQRYLFLFNLYENKVITDLKLQHVFTLQEAYTTPAGERVRAITYKADFSYCYNGRLIVEDVKSEITRKKPDYRIKVKMMQDKFDIKVIEILDVSSFEE